MALNAALCFIAAVAAAVAGALITDTGALTQAPSNIELAMWTLSGANAGLLSGAALLHHRLRELGALTQNRLTLLTLAGSMLILAGGTLGHLAART